MDTYVSEDPPGSNKKQKHGLACKQCAAAKTRCERSDKASSCERCLLLKKECISQTPQPRKRKAGPPTTTRVAQLEQKLDGLVTLLTSQQAATTEEESEIHEAFSSRHPHMSTKLPTPDNSIPGSSNDYTSPLSDGPHRSSRPAIRPATRGASHLDQTGTISEASSLQFEDGRIILDIFYTRMLPYFPFAVLEPDDTVLSLQTHKPFLWKVLRYIALTRDPKQQMDRGTEIMQDICDQMLLNTNKSLELLQGIILFAAWNHFQFTVNGQMTHLVYLAKALMNNLGLDRAPGILDRRSQWLSGNPLRCNVASSADVRQHTLAQRRAFLTCYYLCVSRVKLGGGNAEIFHYTPYINTCCDRLEAESECQSDILLAYIVRLQRIVEEIHETFPFEEVETFKALGTPVALCIKALRMKLAALKAALPAELEHNRLFLMTYHTAEMSLYEVALYDSPVVTTQNPTIYLQLDRLGLLHGCLASLTEYFNIYNTLPTEDGVTFPFTIWMQSGLAILTAIEMAFLRLDGWDTSQARNLIDIRKTLDREIQNMEAIAFKRHLHPLDDINKDIFTKFAARMRKTRSMYDSRMSVEIKSGKATVNNQNAAADIDMTATMDGLLGDNSMAGWDQSFWQTFISDQWDDMAMLGNGMS